MALTPLFAAIDQLMAEHPHVIVAIDGPCASGKTTLAATLSSHYHAAVIHMDDFFLPPNKRTEERLSQPGGNVDGERFLQEVLTPLIAHIPFSYRPWRCHTGLYDQPIALSPAPLTIVEGAYSLRSDFRHHYHLRIFLSAPLPIREERIRVRNGDEGLITFQNRWIPLENRYFDSCSVEQCCHFSLSS